MKSIHERLREDLDHLCTDIGARPVGSEANRRAVAWATRELERAGWDVERQDFSCLDWRHGEASLTLDGRVWALEPGPFAPSYEGESEIITATRLSDLTSRAPGDAHGRVLFLRGEIASEQLFPRNFPFFRMDEHVAIYEAIERLEPAALITATPPNTELAGGIYPLPMIEDGDFPVPSAYTTAEAGAELADALARRPDARRRVRLRVDSERREATAANPIARWPPTSTDRPLVLLAAHIDTKPDTPGALDNAAGVVTLLAAARIIATTATDLPVEIALFNGEDYYSAPGQVAYLGSGALAPGRVALAVNVDGAGLRGYPAAWSTYDVGSHDRTSIEEVFSGYAGLVAGEQWFQGDHAIFVQSGVRALAVTCAAAGMEELLGIAHTAADTPELVDVATMGEIADALARLATDPRLRATPAPG